MPRVLLTAFEPYDRWKTNSSWLALIHLTGEMPPSQSLTTRLLPVDFSQMKARLAEELENNYDYALHLGQSPGSTRLQLEAIGQNVGGSSSQAPDQYLPLCTDGPVAYRSQLPLAQWALKLRRAGVPAQVSYHAGTFLCNATLYWTHYLAERMRLKTQAAFIHVPLDVSQVVQDQHPPASLPVAYSALAVQLILEELGIVAALD